MKLKPRNKITKGCSGAQKAAPAEPWRYMAWLFEDTEKMIRLVSIDHVCLLVTSISRSKSYYKRVFDFNCTPGPDDPKTLMVESPNIHFFISEVYGVSTDFLSKQHLSFEVDNLDHVVSSLEELGISDYETGEFRMFQHRNYKWCEWRDPDGIRIECVERTPGLAK